MHVPVTHLQCLCGQLVQAAGCEGEPVGVGRPRCQYISCESAPRHVLHVAHPLLKHLQGGQAQSGWCMGRLLLQPLKWVLGQRWARVLILEWRSLVSDLSTVAYAYDGLHVYTRAQPIEWGNAGIRM